MGELLLPECALFFDPSTSLLGKNVKIQEVVVEDGSRVASLSLHLKSRSENRLSGITLEILEVVGDNCPVLAIQRRESGNSLSKSQTQYGT